MSRSGRIGIVTAAVVVAVAAFIALRPGGEKSPENTGGEGTATATTTTGGSAGNHDDTGHQGTTGGDHDPDGASDRGPGFVRIRIENGKPVGGVEKVSVHKGETVRLAVTPDTEAAVHIHGYDLIERVGAGKTARFEFPARLEGAFEVELHAEHAVKVAELEVSP